MSNEKSGDGMCQRFWVPERQFFHTSDWLFTVCERSLFLQSFTPYFLWHMFWFPRLFFCMPLKRNVTNCVFLSSWLKWIKWEIWPKLLFQDHKQWMLKLIMKLVTSGYPANSNLRVEGGGRGICPPTTGIFAHRAQKVCHICDKNMF